MESSEELSTLKSCFLRPLIIAADCSNNIKRNKVDKLNLYQRVVVEHGLTSTLTCNSYTGTSNDWRPLCHNYHSRHYL